MTSYKAKRRKADKRMNQPPRILTTIGLEVPSDFPLEPYEAVVTATRPHFVAAGPALRREFDGAWNAVGHRFLAALDYSKGFRDASKNLPTPHLIRHEEERASFGFFANAVSSVEATFYGLYAIGTLLSALSPLYFWLMFAGRQDSVTPASTCRAYGGGFPADPIVAALDSVRTDKAFIRLKAIRNILTHRAAPTRQYVAGGTTEWYPGIPLAPDMLAPLCADLTRLLRQVLDATAAFVALQRF